MIDPGWRCKGTGLRDRYAIAAMSDDVLADKKG